MPIHRIYARAPDGTEIPSRRASVLQTPPAPLARDIPSDPTPLDLATNFASALARAGHAALTGAQVWVTEPQLRARETACAPCEYWDDAARLGLGKCSAPGCGCTHFKRHLATETCKHPAGSKWRPLVP